MSVSLTDEGLDIPDAPDRPGEFEQSLRDARDNGRKLLVAYVTGGLHEEWPDVVRAVADAGADAIEIGIPFSDPVMDGPVIQQASQRALDNGFTASQLFDVIEKSKASTVTMTYWNPIERMGIENFLTQLRAAGGVGVITPDLTIDESDEWISQTSEMAIDRIYVVAPSTSDERLKKVADATSGFIYAASLMGVTGTRSALSGSARELVSRVRKVTSLPIAVGLGVSNAEQAREIASFADGVIVGSAFIKLVLESPNEKEAVEKVRVLAAELAQAVRQPRS